MTLVVKKGRRGDRKPETAKRSPIIVTISRLALRANRLFSPCQNSPRKLRQRLGSRLPHQIAENQFGQDIAVLSARFPGVVMNLADKPSIGRLEWTAERKLDQFSSQAFADSITGCQ